jgi:predicted nucleic acid-binding protein
VKRYLVDTNIVSELRKPKPHGGVTAWLTSLNNEQIFFSSVTFGELQAGIEKTRVQDAAKAEEIEKWVDYLHSSAQILPMDAECFREWARLMRREPDHVLEDAMIAATARVHGLTVATRNERDFERFGIPLINPFETSR